jgi:HAMP domain-containing protein
MLVQVGLDDTIPYEPFRLDKRYELAGFTSRTNVEGWYGTVQELGRRDGRVDLREWIDIPTKDEDTKTAWLAAHPTDPLALHANALREKKLGVAPTRAAAATGAAALAASAIGSGRSSPTPVQAAPLSSTATVVEEDHGFEWMIPLLLLGIGLLFLFAWLNRTQALPRTAGLVTQVVATCPAGTMPRDVFASETLEAGPIINDVDN